MATKVDAAFQVFEFALGEIYRGELAEGPLMAIASMLKDDPSLVSYFVDRLPNEADPVMRETIAMVILCVKNHEPSIAVLREAGWLEEDIESYREIRSE